VAIADLFDVVDDYVLLAAAWTLGEGIRQRRLHAAELEVRPPAGSGNARRGPGKRPPRNAFGSPASCTTWWPTA
jgi:hypothetical protein